MNGVIGMSALLGQTGLSGEQAGMVSAIDESAHVLVAILKKRTGVDRSLNEILQITSVGIFEQTPASIVFSDASQLNTPIENNHQFQKSFPGWDL